MWTDKCDILQFVARCGMPDLALDTYPINAHTVAMDYLWMGTPLLTMAGEGWASRVASSVLSAHDVAWREFLSTSWILDALSWLGMTQTQSYLAIQVCFPLLCRLLISA